MTINEKEIGTGYDEEMMKMSAPKWPKEMISTSSVHFMASPSSYIIADMGGMPKEDHMVYNETLKASYWRQIENARLDNLSNNRDPYPVTINTEYNFTYLSTLLIEQLGFTVVTYDIVKNPVRTMVIEPKDEHNPPVFKPTACYQPVEPSKITHKYHEFIDALETIDIKLRLARAEQDVFPVIYGVKSESLFVELAKFIIGKGWFIHQPFNHDGEYFLVIDPQVKPKNSSE